MHICINLPQGFGVAWHSSMSTHLPPEPGSKPRGQFVREPVVFGVVVEVIRAVVIGDVRACGVGMRACGVDVRGIRSQRYEPRVFLH